MLFGNADRGIGRGEVAESRIEAPFLAAFMVLCAMVLLLVHLRFQHYALTVALAVTMIAFGATVVRVDLGVAILVVVMLMAPEIDLAGKATSEHTLNIRYDDVLIVVIFFGVLVKTAFDGRGAFWRPNPLNGPIVLHYLVCIMATLLAVRANLGAWDRRNAFFVILKMAEYYMVFLLTANALNTLRDVRRQLTLFFAVAAFLSLYAMISAEPGERIGTPFQPQGPEPNTMGGYLIVVMSVAIGLMTQAPHWRQRALFLALMMSAFLPFLFTLSRASYFGALVAFVTLGALGRKWYLLAAVALTLALSPVIMPEAVKERVNYTFQRGEGEPIVIAGRPTGLQVDKSTYERIYVCEKVKFILHVAPWFGGGVGWGKILDSQYARVIMETGLIGLAAFVFLQWRLFRTCRETYRWSRVWMARGLGLGMAAATAGLVAHSFGTISFLIVRIMEPYWLLMALVVVARAAAIEDYARQLQARRRAQAASANRERPAANNRSAPAPAN